MAMDILMIMVDVVGGGVVGATVMGTGTVGASSSNRM